MTSNRLKAETVYDDLWRLTQDNVTDAEGLVYREDFQYDPVGNRLRRDLAERHHVERIDVWTYDHRDRIETHNGRRWLWDRGGRVREQPGWWDQPDKTYRWWLDDHLLEASTSDGTTVTTTYDTDGARTKSTETVRGQTKTTSYLVDDSGWLSHVVADIRDDETTVYTRNGDQLLGLTRDTPSYYHSDGLGSIRTLTDPSGTVTEELDYSAFGRLLNGDLSVQRYTFTGEPRSAMGLSYHRARWMDPRLGRFLSMDPFSGLLSLPVTLHKYLYAQNDPSNQLDPTGLISVASKVAALSVRVSLTTMNMGARVASRFAAGTVGNFFRALGRYAELVAARTIRLIPNLTVARRSVKVGSRAIDFLLKSGKSYALLEVKYSLPFKAAAVARLAGQIRAGLHRDSRWWFGPSGLQLPPK